MQVPEGGQQEPFTGNGLPIVSHFARRGDCLRGALSHMSRIVIAIEMLSGLGIGLGLGFGMFAPFGDGALGGRLSPGSLAPSARRSPGAIQGVAPPGPLVAQLSRGPLGIQLSIQGVAPSGPLVAQLSRGPLGIQLSIQGVAPPGPLVAQLSRGPLGIQLSLGVACRPIVSQCGLASNCLSVWLAVQ